MYLINNIISDDNVNKLSEFIDGNGKIDIYDILSIILKLDAVHCFQYIIKNNFIDINKLENINYILKDCIFNNSIKIFKNVLSTNKRNPKYNYNDLLDVSLNYKKIDIINYLINDFKLNFEKNDLFYLCKLKGDYVNLVKSVIESENFVFVFDIYDVESFLEASLLNNNLKIFKYLINECNLEIPISITQFIPILVSNKELDFLSYLFKFQHIKEDLKANNLECYLNVEKLIIKEKIENF